MKVITTLSPAAVIETLQGRLEQASKDFIDHPNAARWNIQTRNAFVYQQAFYFLGSLCRTTEEKFNLLVALSRDPDGNWGDAICLSALGMSLSDALREHANCP